MPSKKKKYNARFPAGRIKKIMQSDEEVGKVAQAVPIIISKTLELFVESLLTKTLKITNSRNAKTLSTSHMKQCIMSEQRFDFLRELVKNIPDISVAEEAANYNEEDNQSSPEEQYPDSDTPYDLSMPSTSLRATKLVSSNGQNGGQTHQLQQQQYHDHQRNPLKRSISSNPNSVIRQPNADCLPSKIPHFDSTSVPSQLSTSPLISLSSSSSIQHHPRLKHQSYSMPSSYNDNNNKPNTNTPPKQLRSPTQHTAIPAPIVSIDYCSKPVVKIDYSNIPLAGESPPEAPLTAPANIASMSGNNTAFDFSTEPVINIDLSNIVASSSSSSSSSSINKIQLFPAVAVDQQSRNSKVTMAEPLNSSITSYATKSKTNLSSKPTPIAATAMTSTISTTNSDSYLDMDEDYDNI